VNRVRLSLLALALALFLAACGSGGQGQGANETGEEEEQLSEVEDPSASSESPSEAASEGAAAGGEAVAAIEEAGVLRCGTKFDQPLFGLAGLGGEPEGFDVEMCKLIAESILGDPEAVEYTETVSANREEFLQNGDVDVVAATYTINETREEVIDFAGPYYIAGGEIMVTAGNPLGIESIDDLNGKRVCTANGSTYVDSVAEQAPEADLGTLFDTYSECAAALSDGRIDAVATDNVILAGIVSQNEGQYELVGESFTEEPYGIGVAQGSDLCEYINGVLEEAYESGAWEEAYTATVGTVITEVPEPPATEPCGE